MSTPPRPPRLSDEMIPVQDGDTERAEVFFSRIESNLSGEVFSFGIPKNQSVPGMIFSVAGGTSRSKTSPSSLTWEMIRVDAGWVGINTLHPNHLVTEGIESGVIRELHGCESIRREVCTRQGTRLDLCLQGSNGSCFVEVKNVTLAIDGAAAFPDAVSERGLKHLKELIWLRRRGHRAAVVFVVQRSDCNFFRPADEIDQEYGRWLRRAVEAGVEALPYRAHVTPKEILLTERLPIIL